MLQLLCSRRKHMKKFFKDFKTFISRGNVLDLAVGVIIGGAFTAIVTAVTNKILMPVINWILALIVGGDGLEAVYTFLKKTYIENDPAKGVDLANSIYIDWGAFIIAIIDFILIALVLFLIIRAIMKAQSVAQKSKESRPNKEEKAELKAAGVNLKNRKEVKAKVAELRAEKKAKAEAEAKAQEEANKKPTTEELLADILEEIKKK
ncbi:MAG TPA: large conductance mechanosensitive channel protein MscL [Clostridiales bacterium]|nr:large conductance mechanosensitive channel protein MscL [Clostridiales bacterium]